MFGREGGNVYSIGSRPASTMRHSARSSSPDARLAVGKVAARSRDAAMFCNGMHLDPDVVRKLAPSSCNHMAVYHQGTGALLRTDSLPRWSVRWRDAWLEAEMDRSRGPAVHGSGDPVAGAWAESLVGAPACIATSTDAPPAGTTGPASGLRSALAAAAAIIGGSNPCPGTPRSDWTDRLAAAICFPKQALDRACRQSRSQTTAAVSAGS